MTEPLKINVCLIDINITCICRYIYTGASLVAQWLKKPHIFLYLQCSKGLDETP